jgi:DNA-binding MarR family transcriptional regulator
MSIQHLIKARKFESSNLKAHINLIYTYYHFNKRHCELLEEYDILPQHYNVLKIIKGKFPEPVSPSYILEVILDKKRDITRLVDKLVSLGYLVRCKNPNSKRNIDISLTKEGDEVLKELDKIVIEKLRHNLSEEESELLSNLLDKMR